MNTHHVVVALIVACCIGGGIAMAGKQIRNVRATDAMKFSSRGVQFRTSLSSAQDDDDPHDCEPDDCKPDDCEPDEERPTPIRPSGDDPRCEETEEGCDDEYRYGKAKRAVKTHRKDKNRKGVSKRTD